MKRACLFILMIFVAVTAYSQYPSWQRKCARRNPPSWYSGMIILLGCNTYVEPGVGSTAYLVNEGTLGGTATQSTHSLKPAQNADKSLDFNNGVLKVLNFYGPPASDKPYTQAFYYRWEAFTPYYRAIGGAGPSPDDSGIMDQLLVHMTDLGATQRWIGFSPQSLTYDAMTPRVDITSISTSNVNRLVAITRDSVGTQTIYVDGTNVLESQVGTWNSHRWYKIGGIIASVPGVTTKFWCFARWNRVLTAQELSEFRSYCQTRFAP